MSPAWLSRYYDAPTRDVLNPTIVFEGKKKAVIRLTKRKSRTGGGVAYVGVEKTGRHHTSKHIALHEGPAGKQDLQRMAEWLAKVDG